MFYTNYSTFRAYVILQAPGGDGKSTTINFINSLLPQNEVCHVSLQSLTASERSSKNFSVVELRNKRLNSRNDITGDFIQDGSVLKTLTGNDPINASVKNKADLQFTNFAKFIFACNKLPEFRDTSEGWGRRAYVLTAHSIKKSHKKFDLSHIYDERGAFVAECIKLFCERAKQQKKENDNAWELYRDDDSRKNLDQWLEDNDNVKQFLDECAKKSAKDKRLVSDTYQAYKNWCEDAGVKPLSRSKFGRELENKGFKRTKTTWNGKNGWYWDQLKLMSDTVYLPDSF